MPDVLLAARLPARSTDSGRAWCALGRLTVGVPGVRSSLDTIVRTMKTGVCDVLVFPFTRAQLKGLATRYLLNASEKVYLKDQAKRIAVLMDTEKQQRALQARSATSLESDRMEYRRRPGTHAEIPRSLTTARPPPHPGCRRSTTARRRGTTRPTSRTN